MRNIHDVVQRSKSRCLPWTLILMLAACSSSDDSSDSPADGNQDASTEDAATDGSVPKKEGGSDDASPPLQDGSASDGDEPTEDGAAQPDVDEPEITIEKDYEIDSTTAFLNPERGFHGGIELTSTNPNYDYIRQRGYTLARSYVRLDDYRNTKIPQDYLAKLRNGLAKLRTAGIKAVPRFAYNFGMDPDAPLAIVLDHIEQLTPILTEYADVIAVLHAGFVGAWGEWHGSTNDLDSPTNKKTIGEALLEALPDSRMIQIRTPGHRRHVVGPPSAQVELFGTSNEARIGFLNDCFLSSASDAGTYLGDQVTDRNEAKDYSRYTSTGGETCSIDFGTSRQKCKTALEELAEFHWDYLNSDYYKDVLDGWKSEGCYEEIDRRLGYRIGLESARIAGKVKAGGVLKLELMMKNDGFGKVYNPRPIDIVLRDKADHSTVVRAVDDSRTMLPLAGQSRKVELTIQLPGALSAGEYTLLLKLPDPSSQLEGDLRYHIRLANVDMWEEKTGLNDLGLIIEVES